MSFCSLWRTSQKLTPAFRHSSRKSQSKPRFACSTAQGVCVETPSSTNQVDDVIKGTGTSRHLSQISNNTFSQAWDHLTDTDNKTNNRASFFFSKKPKQRILQEVVNRGTYILENCRVIWFVLLYIMGPLTSLTASLFIIHTACLFCVYQMLYFFLSISGKEHRQWISTKFHSGRWSWRWIHYPVSKKPFPRPKGNW